MPRRLLVLVPVLLALAGCGASGSHTTAVIVQGTTDVRDAGLLDDVIAPGFHKAYPQYTLKYIAVGSGEALTNAKAGQGDAVLTHAPPLEAQFVKGGYSYEPAGRAVFYSDYVILGPKSDPAGVLSGAPHDAARALELIARAGAAGRANFVSRGDNSGTNVKELAIWKLTRGVSLAGSGEPGGGGADAGWYHKAGLGQADTVKLTEQCPFKGGGCYEISDRGTFNRLVARHAVASLRVVADRNAAAARGGVDLLVNSFHVYAVNPKKVSSANLRGALAFLDYLVSPAFQARLASYPNTQQPAFIADARPRLTITSQRLAGAGTGAGLAVAGTIASSLPGAAPLQGSVLALEASPRNVLARTTVDADGRFSFRLAAWRGGSVQIAFPRTGDLSASRYRVGSARPGA